MKAKQDFFVPSLQLFWEFEKYFSIKCLKTTAVFISPPQFSLCVSWIPQRYKWPIRKTHYGIVPLHSPIVFFPILKKGLKPSIIGEKTLFWKSWILSNCTFSFLWLVLALSFNVVSVQSCKYIQLCDFLIKSIN